MVWQERQITSLPVVSDRDPIPRPFRAFFVCQNFTVELGLNARRIGDKNVNLNGCASALKARLFVRSSHITNRHTYEKNYIIR